METGPVTARANHDAAESAALARIADLETQLARERAESARRLTEFEPRMRQLRESLHSMQMKLQHAAEEQILLEARLAGDAHEVERLTHRVAELEEQIRRGTAQTAAAPTARSDDGRPPRDEPPAAPPRVAESRAVAKLVVAHPLLATAIAAALVVAAVVWLRFGPGFGPSVRERFDAAVDEAGALAAKGDTVGAAITLAPFVEDTGDPAVEREAAARLQKLRLR